MINRKEFEKALIDRGITQSELAKILKKSPNTISNWINGKSSPTTYDVANMCEALNIKDDKLKILIFLNKTSHKWD